MTTTACNSDQFDAGSGILTLPFRGLPFYIIHELDSQGAIFMKGVINAVRNSDANREVTATSLSSEMEGIDTENFPFSLNTLYLGLFTKHLEQETQELLPMAGLVTVLVGSPTLLLGQHFG